MIARHAFLLCAALPLATCVASLVACEDEDFVRRVVPVERDATPDAKEDAEADQGDAGDAGTGADAPLIPEDGDAGDATAPDGGASIDAGIRDAARD
jgi:hypothetical protein